MNITSALNRTSIVWQDVFDYNERVSTHQQNKPLFTFFISLQHHHLFSLHQKFNYYIVTKTALWVPALIYYLNIISAVLCVFKYLHSLKEIQYLNIASILSQYFQKSLFLNFFPAAGGPLNLLLQGIDCQIVGSNENKFCKLVLNSTETFVILSGKDKWTNHTTSTCNSDSLVLCCSVALCQWWRYGRRAVTCVKYAGWLKQDSEWF